MNPVIPEVVFVMEPRSVVSWRKDFAQLGVAGILIVLVARHVQVSIFHTADVEAIEMLKFPAHRYLDERMKFFQRTVLRLDTSPDRRVDALQGHFDLKNGVSPCCKPMFGHL